MAKNQLGSAPTEDTDAATKAYVDAALAALSVPAGVIETYAGAAAPTGYLLCDGANVSRTTYAALFAVIGTTFGAGDGSTTFAVPNLKGRVVVGIDAGQTEFDTRGETGGSKTHTLTTTEMPVHTHVQDSHTHTQASHGHSITDTGHNHTQNSHGHTTAEVTHTHTINPHTHTVNNATVPTSNHFHDLSSNGWARIVAGTNVNGYNTIAVEYKSLTSGDYWTADARSNGAINMGASTLQVMHGTVLDGNTNSNTSTQTISLGDASPTVVGAATGLTVNSSVATNNSSTTGITIDGTTATNNATTATNQSTGGGGAHNNLQPYMALNYIIKI